MDAFSPQIDKEARMSKDNNLPKQIKSEDKIRQELMLYAVKIGAEKDLQLLFDRWDRAIALAPPDEKVDMARAAILEVQSLLDIHPEYGDGLTIGGEIVIPAAKERHDTILQPVAVKKDK